VLYVAAYVCGSWTRVQRGTCHVGSWSDLYTVLLFCLYFLAILVCNFACELCCLIINVYSVKKLCMLYCFYYVPNQNKVFLSYLTACYYFHHIFVYLFCLSLVTYSLHF
jgi:hypothetical protein